MRLRSGVTPKTARVRLWATPTTRRMVEIVDSAHPHCVGHDLRTDTSIGAARVLVRMWGEIDCISAPDLELAIRDGLRMSPVVALDLSGITFIDSFGLRSLIVSLGRAAPADRLTIVAASRPVTRLLVMTGLDVAFGLRVSFA